MFDFSAYLEPPVIDEQKDIYLLVWASYTIDNYKPVVILMGRDKQLQKHIFRFRFDPYMYGTQASIDGLIDHDLERAKYIRGRGDIYNDYLYDIQVQKVYTRFPSDVPKIRDQLEMPCEADVLFEARFLIDHGIKRHFIINNSNRPEGYPREEYPRDHVPEINFFDIGLKHRICYFDTEWERAGTDVNPEIDRLLSLQIADNYTWDIHVIVCPPGDLYDLYKNIEHQDIVINDHDVCDDDRWGKHGPLDYFDLGVLDDFIVQAQVHVVYTEKDLFDCWINLQEHYKFDVYTGWFTRGFDWPMVIRRAIHLGYLLEPDQWGNMKGRFTRLAPLGYIKQSMRFNVKTNKKEPDYKIGGFQNIDMLDDVYKKIKERDRSSRSWEMKDCANAEFLFPYIDYGHEIGETMLDPERFIDYGIRDVIAPKGIEYVTKGFELYEYIGGIGGTLLQDSYSNKRLITTGLLHIAKQWRTPLPYRGTGKKKDVVGAYVHLPPVGIHRRIMIFDFKAMYTTIIRVANIDPRMLLPDDYDGDCYTAGDYKFKKDELGIMPYFIAYAMMAREKIRTLRLAEAPKSHKWKLYDLHEKSCKVVGNAGYGALAMPSFILYNNSCAQAITGVGRELDHVLIEIAEEMGFRVIYSDTDSIFIEVGTIEEGLRLEKAFQKELDKYAIEKGFEYSLEIKAEKFMYTLIFIFKVKKGKKEKNKARKKGYSGYVTWMDGEVVSFLHTKGLAPRRSDQAMITQRTMNRVFTLLLQEDRMDDAFKEIKKSYDSLPELSPHLYGRPRALHKGLDGYDAVPPWVHGVNYAQNWFGRVWDKNFKPLLFYVKNVKPLRLTQDELDVLKDRINRWAWKMIKVEYNEQTKLYVVHIPKTKNYCLVSSDDTLPPEIEIAFDNCILRLPPGKGSKRKSFTKDKIVGMKTKCIRDAFEPLIRTLGYDIDAMLINKTKKIKEQSSLSSFIPIEES